jgi:RNA recognition motif-containing protein
MKMYVGNLARDITEDDLRHAFEAFGAVESVNVIKDKFTSEPKGFGFVEMPNKVEAEAAMAGLNGKEMKGQTIKVSEARPPSNDRRGGNKRGGVRRF